MAKKKSAKKASKPVTVKSAKPAAKKAEVSAKKAAKSPPKPSKSKPASKKVPAAKGTPTKVKPVPAKKPATKGTPKKAAPVKVAKGKPAAPKVPVKATKSAPKAAATKETKKTATAAPAKKMAVKAAKPTPRPAAPAVAPAKKEPKTEASPKVALPATPTHVSKSTPPAKPAAPAPAPTATPKELPAKPPAPAATVPAVLPRPIPSDRPRSLLGVAALPPGGMPEWWRWHQDYPGEDTMRRGTVLTSFNLYRGLYTDTLRIHMAAGQSGIRAVSYSSKFSVDGDGSGGKQKGDSAFQDSTSLHLNDGNPPSKKNALNSLTYPFAVLPLPPKSSNTLNFQALGLDVGDIGIAFFGRGQAAPFIYGDEGPPLQVGEGSIQMAKDLGMDWEGKMNTSPATGGFNENEMRTYAPGVLHIAFPGSRARTDRITDLLTREALQAKAWDLFKRWKQSLRGGAV